MRLTHVGRSLDAPFADCGAAVVHMRRLCCCTHAGPGQYDAAGRPAARQSLYSNCSARDVLPWVSACSRAAPDSLASEGANGMQSAASSTMPAEASVDLGLSLGRLRQDVDTHLEMEPISEGTSEHSG